jgi:hypothetical protein
MRYRPEHVSLQPLFAAQPYIDGSTSDDATDVNCTLARLPELLSVGRTVAIDGHPYLEAPPHRISETIKALPRPRVAVIWRCGEGRGGAYTHAMALRSMPPRFLAPAWQLPGVSWISLQKEKGPSAEVSKLIKRYGVLDLSQLLTDFAATAAAMRACDLVITVDTSTAHLAGALGVPTWILLHDRHEWRWYGPTPATTWWYSNVRLFRRSRGDGWDAAIESVVSQLAHFRDESPP